MKTSPMVGCSSNYHPIPAEGAKLSKLVALPAPWYYGIMMMML